MFVVALKGNGGMNTNLMSIKIHRKLWIKPFFPCQRISSFSVCCLLCYSTNLLHITLFAHEFQSLPYIHYQHVKNYCNA